MTVSASTVVVVGGVMANGNARYGGGIAAQKGSSVVVSGLQSSGNRATSGGAYYLVDNAAVSVVNVVCDGNAAKDGGCAYISGTLSAGVGAQFDAVNSIFTGNVASRRGGALLVAGDSTVAVNGSALGSNIAFVHGGGVFHSTSAAMSTTGTSYTLNQVRACGRAWWWSARKMLQCDAAAAACDAKPWVARCGRAPF